MNTLELVKEAMNDDKVHLSTLIDKIDAIYIYDDIEDVYYQNEIDEALGNNSVPVDTIISTSDVESILNKIKNCNRIFIEPRPKNNSFLVDYNLDEKDCKNIINQLSVRDYVKSTTSVNSKHAGDNLVIFEPSLLVVNGNKIEGVIV